MIPLIKHRIHSYTVDIIRSEWKGKCGVSISYLKKEGIQKTITFQKQEV
jgi:hypothetical protein